MSESVAPFKDYFSAQAAAYADFRPRYPEAMFAYLASLAPDHRLAWDCATGSGQAALGLAAHFAHVIATDASEQQLAHAEPHPRIRYYRATAEASGIDDHMADLVMVAQALHWFDHPAFFAEVLRVLRPRGVFAASCYDLVRVTPEIDAVLDHYYAVTLRGYWAPERRLVDEHYRSISLPAPLEEIDAPSFVMEHRWTRAHLLGYLRTWSGTRAYVERVGRDPVLQVEQEIAPLWPNPAEERDVRWPLYLKVGR
jgi:SAM-dependent methyltransferase